MQTATNTRPLNISRDDMELLMLTPAGEAIYTAYEAEVANYLANSEETDRVVLHGHDEQDYIEAHEAALQEVAHLILTDQVEDTTLQPWEVAG